MFSFLVNHYFLFTLYSVLFENNEIGLLQKIPFWKLNKFLTVIIIYDGYLIFDYHILHYTNSPLVISKRVTFIKALNLFNYCCLNDHSSIEAYDSTDHFLQTILHFLIL